MNGPASPQNCVDESILTLNNLLERACKDYHLRTFIYNAFYPWAGEDDSYFVRQSNVAR